MENNYYVYVYLDPLKPNKYQFGKFSFDYEPFYIGMGKNQRINQHINESKNEKNKTAKHYKILKILKNGLEPIRYKLYENITKESAYRLEIYLINLIGRRDLKLGTLTNLRDGGSGSHEITEETKNKMRKNQKNMCGKNNPNFGNKWTDEQKKKASIKLKLSQHNKGDNNVSKRPEVKAKIAESKMGLKNPQASKWRLISSTNEEIIIEGGIKRNLKKYGLSYQKNKWNIENGFYILRNGWKLQKIDK